MVLGSLGCMLASTAASTTGQSLGLGWLDGSIVGVYLLVTMVAGLMVRKYVGKVEHFLMAGREMNVYLGVASLAATEFGIVTCMYTAQNGYEKGFAGATPGILYFLAMLVVGWTGFCVKPLRDSGVMTIPELFEKRFGSRVRWLAGVVIVLGGLLNMGVFLQMGGKFLVYVCGFDARYLVMTMTLLLVGVATYTILGGMLSVLVTDFLQFIVMSVGLIVTTFLILRNIGWDALAAAVQTHYGDGGFNPFANAEMGGPYIGFNALINLAAVLTWQTIIQRLLAAKDTATGRKIYTRTSFFFVCRFLIPGIWGVAALATIAPAALPLLNGKPDTILAMPMFLGQFHMPIGFLGLLVAAMLAADMSTDSSYMLTWGSIIYNDILAPLRRNKPWSERFGLFVSRTIIALIGVFLLIYGLWYRVEGDLWDYLTVTGAIYLSSMSVLLIACCYWKRANSWGAGAAIIVGAVIPSGFLIMQKLPRTADWAESIGPHYSGIAAFVGTTLAMIIGSLLKPGGHRTVPTSQEVYA